MQAGQQPPQQGQQGIEGEGHHCGRGPDAPQQGQGEQQAKDGQAGDGLHPIGQAEHQPGPGGPVTNGHPEGQGDQQGQSHCQGH